MQGSSELPLHVVVLAEIVLRFAHDLHFGFALKEYATAQGSVGVVEGRVGEDVIGAVVGVQDVAEGVGVLGAEVGLDAADGGVHDGESAGGGVALFRLLPPQPYPAGSLCETKWALPPRPFVLPLRLHNARRGIVFWQEPGLEADGGGAGVFRGGLGLGRAGHERGSLQAEGNKQDTVGVGKDFDE